MTFDNTYTEGSYQRGYRDYLRKCAKDGTTSEITQASSFHAGYAYALRHAMQLLATEIENDNYTQETIDALVALRLTLRKPLI